MTQYATAAHRIKYVLNEAALPTQWYNIQADLKTPVPPVLHPGTGQAIGPQDLAPLFPMALIAQEVSPAGSHKPNTSVARAYYNKQEGVTRLTTETGAGQWGSALACAFFDLECKVYMVKILYDQKPYRRVMTETWGAQVVASPSLETQAGRTVLAQDPDSPGSLGIAISEAVEDAVQRDDTNMSSPSIRRTSTCSARP